ncbi:MAG: hypothetical protein JO320_06000 [Alphaproteobacteria bacterium]|nr:hypothetical protein [Alphaproteobacteria bacterium]
MASRTRRQMPARAAADITPTPERSTHGVVERAERIISDVVGRPGRPYRLVDTLAMMERRGSITAGMRQAGEDFRDRFAVAQLDPLKAFDISRPRIANRTGFRGGNEPGSRIESARKVVWDAILAVGGLGSAGGSCVWHVVGWQQSLKEWALEQGWNGRRISQEAASGILIASLGTLEAHFAQLRRC